jgi:hypothetical protein
MPLLLQLIGSAIALAAFTRTQAGWMTATSKLYLTLNIIGSAGLVSSAIAEAQWGFGHAFRANRAACPWRVRVGA